MEISIMTFYSIFGVQGSLEGGPDSQTKMMMMSCSKFEDVWHQQQQQQQQQQQLQLKEDFDDEEDFLDEEDFGPDGFPRGKRLAPVGANDEVKPCCQMTNIMTCMYRAFHGFGQA